MGTSALQIETSAHTIPEYRAMVLKDDCRWCGEKLPQKVDSYPHTDGWPVIGESELQWLSLECKCGYEWSLWKLGVPRVTLPSADSEQSR